MSAGVRSLFPARRFKFVPDPGDRIRLRQLPAAYKKFYAEWKDVEPKPIHWETEKDKWRRDPETGEVKVIQNEPIPVKFPNEYNQQLWGGEGIIEGLVKKGKYRSPVPWFWVPSLQKHVVYSEILNKYFSLVVTERALRLIDENHGFDQYIIKTPASELKSLLALKFKRVLLDALAKRDFSHDDKPRQQEFLDYYQQYMLPEDELEWYGLSVEEAVAKYEFMKKSVAASKIRPLKEEMRKALVNELKNKSQEPVPDAPTPKETSWLSKYNPFSSSSDK